MRGAYGGRAGNIQPPSQMAQHRTHSSHAATRPCSPARDLLLLAIESLPCGLVVFDAGFRVRLCNQVAADLLPDGDDLVEALRELAVESGYEDWPARLRILLTSGRASRVDVTLRRPPNEPEVFLGITLSPLQSPDTGENVGGLLLLEDITGRIGIERRLAISERMAAVGKLAARVAHELNNPLDGILRYTNLAIRANGAPEAEVGDSANLHEKLGRYLDHVRTGILRMEDILSSLLDFSRNAPAPLEQARLNQVIEDAMRAMEGRAQEARVAIVCDLDQADLRLARGGTLFQVFCNLIKNAIDAMAEAAPPEGRAAGPRVHGGTLTITSRIGPADLVVSFEDTGVGLPPQAEKIFEPFFTTKAPGKGTGLGLAVCKELIEKYEGTIEARRRSPRGATFVITLPLRTCAAGSSIRDSRTPTDTSFGGHPHA